MIRRGLWSPPPSSSLPQPARQVVRRDASGRRRPEVALLRATSYRGPLFRVGSRSGGGGLLGGWGGVGGAFGGGGLLGGGLFGGCLLGGSLLGGGGVGGGGCRLLGRR